MPRYKQRKRVCKTCHGHGRMVRLERSWTNQFAELRCMPGERVIRRDERGGCWVEKTCPDCVR